MENIFTSSIGKKIMMAAAGLFLILFLLVHLGINLLLVLSDDTRSFNIAANFMGSNALVKIFEIILFAGFLMHIIYGLVLQFQNWLARPKGYKKTNYSQTSFFSKYMFHTAVIILIFLVIHLIDFYFTSKYFDGVEPVFYDGVEYHDLGALVIAKFRIPAYVILYILSFLFLAFHLIHGFRSAFQSLGYNRKSWLKTATISGYVYTFIVCGGFTIIPLIIYFSQ